MTKPSPLLRALLRERHWQKYATFCKEWDRVARTIDPDLVGTYPSRSQLARWLAGDVKGLPHPDACRVLEGMFPGLTVAQLFAVGTAATSVAPSDRAGPITGSIMGPATGPGGTGVPGGTGPGGSGSGSGMSAGPGTGAGAGAVRQPMTGHAGPGIGRTAGAAVMRGASTDTSLAQQGEVHAEQRTPSGSGTLSEEIAMSTEQSARFVRRARGAVDQDVLDQLGADVRQMAQEYLARPPYMMFRPLSQLRAEVFELLDERQRPAVLPSLYRVAGQLCALLAHACSDLGQPYAADTHTRTAWLCADLADDDPLRAYVRWVQSNVAYWHGDYKRAAELAHSGQRYATVGTSLLRLASQEARAYAAASDHREAERSLATAQAARSQVGPGNDEPGGVFRFEPGKAAYYASEVRLALGGQDNFVRAVAEAEQARDLFAEQPEDERCPEFVAAAQIDLVAAHLALKDLHGAEEHLEPVFALPTESRTMPVIKRMSTTDAVLAGAQFANSALAVDLRERIHLFCAYTATRELPVLAD